MSTNKPASLGIIHKILMIFVAINIIGDIGNVVFWWASPSSRLSLTPSIIGNAAGADNALIAGTIVLLVVAVVYIVSLFGLMKKMLWAPLLVIAISVANRVIAVFLYQISPAFIFWAIWTVILVVVAYLDYKKMKTLS
jgi:hypothetical protein